MEYSLEDRIERIRIMKTQAELTREKCYRDENQKLRVEKIALANIIIEVYDKIICAYNSKDLESLEKHWREYECALDVAAETLTEALKS